MADLKFAEIRAEAPTYDQIAAAYAELHRAFDAAESPSARRQVVRDWDALIRRLDTWQSLTHVRFEQDTRDADAKQALDEMHELEPKLTELAVDWKRKLLASPHRDELAKEFGPQAFALWECHVASYEPAIEAETVEDSRVTTQYTELLASASIPLRGEQLTLPAIDKYREHPDRELRYEAERARWSWFDAQRQTLDAQFDKLVALRHSMATKLGYDDFVGLSYRRMCRVDYGRDEVARFRDAVRDQVTPLCSRLIAQQAETLGLEKSMYWDEGLHDPAGNPRPLGDHDWMVARAHEMFSEMGGGLDDFFRQMCAGDFMDLKGREGKAGGGFCTSLASVGFPFIFANFNGTKGDVEVFTHEMGHAFQNYLSREQPLYDYLWPTYESCEIHSMSLEYLTWPHMEKFFGEGAERFREVHLRQSLLFLPYGVAVDHFQHLVYQQPQATPAQRHAMWQEMEARYLPWRDYGDLPHVSAGGFWQRQRHIYTSPFYYIDYTLALTCALQFWVRSQRDFGKSMESYVALCRRGGEAPFQALAESAGLDTPFHSKSLDQVVQAAQRYLEM